MANPTMVKFGYPRTLVAETEHWSVQLRPRQPTLGSLVLICKDDARAFAELSSGAFTELGLVVAAIERMLRSFVAYERINYLMLMMVDSDVHFHVLPRYEGERVHEGIAFPDAGWPGPPKLEEGVVLSPDAIDALRDRLAALWSASRP